MHADKKLCSFVADADNSAFNLHNLPYGVFCTKNNSRVGIGVRIGEFVLNLSELEHLGYLGNSSDVYFANQSSLNHFASFGPLVWSKVRARIQALLSRDNDELQNHPEHFAELLVPYENVIMHQPFAIGAFTDFYAAEQHATNVGKLFRGNENALLPNWKYLPVAYNGRASTVFLSGKSIARPYGQIKLPDASNPVFAPTNKLDFELEMGVFVGVGNPDGGPITTNNAKSHIFGLVLLNDWSARDVQAFEYQPLGPFLAKSFATTISPWVVPLAALTDSMVELELQSPLPVAYLQQSRFQPNISLRVELKPAGSEECNLICETNMQELYWTMEQMLAHHTINNCIMNSGDLFGTGTISGKKPTSWGSLLELTFNGKEPLLLKENITRDFLKDGDQIIISGYCETKNGKIGFGSLKNTIIANPKKY